MERQTATKTYPLRRALLLLLCLCIVSGLLALGVSGYVKVQASKRILSFEDALSLDADCILVLGAGLRGNGEPSTILADRLDCAVALYESGASDRLLMSGDHSRKDYNEVSAMKAYAVARGVSSYHVFQDHAGFSTYESVYRARDIFSAKKVIIVTQSYHLYRALYIARALGLDAYGVASDARSYARQPYYTVREIVARCKDFLYTLFQPEPTYLGTVIPITGNGNVTNQLPCYPLV